VDDRERLARLRGGDEQAFESFFREWYPKLVRMASAMLRDDAVAEELAQEAMLELWRRREELDPDGSPQAYLLQATRNRALNHLRHLQVQRRTAVHVASEVAREPSAPSLLVAAEMQAVVLETLESLPPRCREVFELSRGKGLKYTDIATTLGISVKAVEAQMGRALKAFRERLSPWLPPGDKL